MMVTLYKFCIYIYNCFFFCGGKQGGIKAVVWTDVLQATVMMVSIVLVFAYAVFRVGGFDIVIDRAIAGARLNPV